jgi:hypothetical protein
MFKPGKGKPECKPEQNNWYISFPFVSMVMQLTNGGSFLSDR